MLRGYCAMDKDAKIRSLEYEIKELIQSGNNIKRRHQLEAKLEELLAERYKMDSINETYKFGSHNATDLVERGKNTYGSKVDNSVCECPVCFGGGRHGLFACKNCLGTGKVENANNYKIKEEHDGTYTVTYADGSSSKRKEGFESKEDAQRWADSKFNSDGTEALKHGEDEQCEGGTPKKDKKKVGPFSENAVTKIEVECPDCGYEGEMTSKSGDVTCPECHKEFKN